MKAPSRKRRDWSSARVFGKSPTAPTPKASRKPAYFDYPLPSEPVQPRPREKQKPRRQPAPRRTWLPSGKLKRKPAPVTRTEPAPVTAATPAAPPVRTEAAPVALPAPRYAVIPAGTALNIRLQDPLDSGVNQAGDSFRGTLDKDLVIGGDVVAQRGAPVTESFHTCSARVGWKAVRRCRCSSQS